MKTNIITAIKTQQKHEDRVSIYVDKKFRIGMSANLLDEIKLRVGSSWNDELEEQLRRRDLTWKAKNAALNYLAARVRSTEEIRTKLRRKEFPEDAIDYALSEMNRLGYLDDHQFAKMFIRDRIRLRPRGARVLAQELRKKGIAQDVIDSAINQTFESEKVSDREMALRSAEVWIRKQKAPKDKQGKQKIERRLYGYLARRGFSTDAIRDALASVPTTFR
jgi:regulatory protein